MKILIVDDETLTREGLIASIDWDLLNIHHIYQAADGKEGITLAKKYQPEIILSDVRMPKMDGITMVEELRKFLPNSSIIFMSGYSDKEYLKAAIKFKAVSYVEKPIFPDEIVSAIKEAILFTEQLKKHAQMQTIHSLEQENRLALELTIPRTAQFQTQHWYEEFHLSPSTIFVTYILHLSTPISELSPSNLENAHLQFSDLIKQYKAKQIHVYKHDQYVIYHVYYTIKPSTATIEYIARMLQSLYLPISNYFLAIGKSVVGLEHVYESYSTAVILLQRSFFYEYNCILYKTHDSEPPCVPLLDPTIDFADILANQDMDATLEKLEHILNWFRKNPQLLPNQVKDIYYKLFMSLAHHAKQHQIMMNEDESILTKVNACNTLIELHNLLLHKMKEFFELQKNYEPENPTIFAIKEFIAKNHGNEALSVKDISEHVYLSMSYICTLFKAETGLTLNQYITEYRINKAKQLLEDPRYKIADISSRVGYSDGNYFGKSFKKAMGLSPSEYREKMIR